jgi:hypothetical protein
MHQMGIRLGPATICLGTAAAVAVLWLAGTQIAGQQAPAARPPFPPYKAARMADGHADLNGVWQALVTANWDIQDHEAQPGPHPEIMGAYGAEPPGQSVADGGEIPYQPWALAKKKENFDKRMRVDVTSDKKWHDLGDPELKCYMPGVPRATYMPFPFQIVQGSNPYILIAYEFASATRTIRMELEGRGTHRFVDGLVARPLGRGYAGRRCDGAA